MGSNTLYNKLQAYFEFENNDKIFFTVIRTIALVVIGIFIKGLLLNEKMNVWEILFSIVSFIAWLYIEVRANRKESNFPITILSHLTAIKDLEELKKQYNRKENIDQYISNSISYLNDRTCPIQSMYEQENHLCEQDIADSLNHVLLDLTQRTQNFLNTDHTKFTVGLFLKKVCDPTIKDDIVLKPVAIVLRDDFNFKGQFPTEIDMGVNNQETPITHYLQSKILEILRVGNFSTEHKTFDKQNYLFVFSPIPNVCANCPHDGAIILISMQEEKAPDDLENILKIFGQITSNWISKFNDCVYKKKDMEELNKYKLEKHKKAVEEAKKLPKPKAGNKTES